MLDYFIVHVEDNAEWFLLNAFRGHKIYLKSGPDYDFVKFRSLVKDITQDFKRISEEIISIECQLRALNPDLSVHVVAVQDYEKQHLELVSFST